MAKFFNNVVVNINILGYTNIHQNDLGNTTTTKEIKVLSNNCNNHPHKKETPDMIYAGFRAENSTIYIPVVVPSSYLKVFYWTEQFDLANEYDPTTSIFTASTNGVYSFSSAIQFVPNSPVDHQVAARFIINGNIETVAIEFTAATASNRSIIEISDILHLNAGDTVEVYFASSVPGVVSSVNNHFAAARFPSPSN